MDELGQRGLLGGALEHLGDGVEPDDLDHALLEVGEGAADAAARVEHRPLVQVGIEDFLLVGLEVVAELPVARGDACVVAVDRPKLVEVDVHVPPVSSVSPRRDGRG